jgi:hypothetical protein
LREKKFAFQGGGRRIPQALPNIAGPEIRILGQNLLLGPTASKKSKDSGDGNAKTANALNAAHLRRINGDELKPSSLSRRYTEQVTGQRRTPSTGSGTIKEEQERAAYGFY